MDFEWHGWSRRGGSGALHVGELPDRKQVCLYTVDGGVTRARAFFRSREDAEAVLRLLDSLMGES